MTRPPSPQMPDLLDRLRARRPSLPAAAARIADVVLAAPEEVVHLSVTEVAERAGASEGSVVAFCRGLGVRGFQHLKIELARGLIRAPEAIVEDLDAGDDPATAARKVFAAAAGALHDTLAALDTAALSRAAAFLRAARRVEVYGIGSAAPVALDAATRLMSLGLDARAATDSHVQAIAAASTSPEVAVLTISHSGSTQETVLATRLAREAGARTVVLTNVGRSPILRHAEVVLHTKARETRLRTEAMTSRIAQLAVIDALVAVVALADLPTAVGSLRRAGEVLALKRY